MFVARRYRRGIRVVRRAGVGVLALCAPTILLATLHATPRGNAGRSDRQLGLYSGGMNGSARAQRVLAFGAIALVGLTLVSIFAILLAPALGMTDYTTGVWPTILVFPVIALPVAFLMLAALLIMAWTRRKS